MHAPIRVLVGSLGAGMLPDAAVGPPAGTVLLDLGPDHPGGTGLLELLLWTEDGRVTRAEVTVGAMHCGAEKLFEVHDYRQIGMLADRHDRQAPFFGGLGVATVGEQLLGLEVPERAIWWTYTRRASGSGGRPCAELDRLRGGRRRPLTAQARWRSSS